jgi:hypothetical protein
MNSTSGCRTSGSCASNLLPYSKNPLPGPIIPLCFVERTPYNLDRSRGASPYGNRLVRLSIGMEETNDLIADLKQALPRMQDGH